MHLPSPAEIRVIEGRASVEEVTLPHNLDAEKSILGGIFLHPDLAAKVYAEIRDLVAPSDFYHQGHAAIFAAIAKLVEVERPIDEITVAEQMKLDGTFGALRAFDDEKYLSILSMDVITVANIAYHAKIVREAARRRWLAQKLSKLYSTTLSGANLDEVGDELEGAALRWKEESQPAKAATLPLLRICDIPDPGPARFLVEKLWVKGAFGFVGAEPKAWKSYLTLYMAICVSSGTRVFNRFAVERGKVLIFSAEGGKGLVRQRTGEMCRALGIGLEELDFNVIDLSVLHLDDPDQAELLMQTAAAARPALIILDPLRELHTEDENDSAVIAKLLGPLRTLQATIGCAVMVIHHMGKLPSTGRAPARSGQRLRGSSALHGASDSALYLIAKGEGESKRVTVTAEHRAAPEPEPFTMALRHATLDEGATSYLEIVDDKDEAEDDTEAAVNAYNSGRKKILKAITLAAMPGREPFKNIKSLAKACNRRAVDLGPILKELIEEGLIVKDGEKGAYRPVQGGKNEA